LLRDVEFFAIPPVLLIGPFLLDLPGPLDLLILRRCETRQSREKSCLFLAAAEFFLIFPGKRQEDLDKKRRLMEAAVKKMMRPTS
jgi:hypothetical protein